jgi:small multidrug resistance pump
MHWILLGIAIVCEVLATSALRASAGFTRWAPSLLVVGGYAVSFYCLSRVVQWLPLGLVYAVWSGAGIVLLSLLGWLVYRQTLDAAALAGIALIVCGVAVIQLFSHVVPH